MSCAERGTPVLACFGICINKLWECGSDVGGELSLYYSPLPECLVRPVSGFTDVCF